MATEEHHYPDAKALRVYAKAPTPFHNLTVNDLRINDGGWVSAHAENVSYRYNPSSLRVGAPSDCLRADDEFDPIEEVRDVTIAHRSAWENATAVNLTEDYVLALGMVTDDRDRARPFGAYWLLDKVTIERVYQEARELLERN